MGWEEGLGTQEARGGGSNTQLIPGQTVHRNGKGEAFDGKFPRCTETAHGKGQTDEADQRRPQRQHLIAHPIAHAASAPPAAVQPAPAVRRRTAT